MYLGHRDESGEAIIGTKEGIVKCRSFRRKVIKEERWDAQAIKDIQGTPWRPVPGRGGDEIRIDVRIPEGKTSIPVPVIGAEEQEITRRRVRINKSDIMRRGMTPKC